MRPVSEFNANEGAAPSSSAGPLVRWRSPVPYLFGGLAGMVGLIFFSLLILACSFRKSSGHFGGGDGDIENRDSDGQPGADTAAKPPESFDTRIVVIMAGDQEPTFLAKPISIRAAASGGRPVDTAKGDNVDDEKEPGKTESAVTTRTGEPTQT